MIVDLAEHYSGYLSALNDRRFDDLARYVAPEVHYNGGPMTLAEYQEARAAEARSIPDLRYHARKVVAAGSDVAAILDFTCTPVDRFAGLTFSGRTIAFTEHVFYEFTDGLITDVTSLLDYPTIERQADPR